MTAPISARRVASILSLCGKDPVTIEDGMLYAGATPLVRIATSTRKVREGVREATERARLLPKHDDDPNLRPCVIEAFFGHGRILLERYHYGEVGDPVSVDGADSAQVVVRL